MTHAELVKRAEHWLRYTKRCRVVLTEQRANNEMPDAIGFTGPGSILVECKTSVSDFYGELAKPWRKDPLRGMGRWRYILCERGLINPLLLEHPMSDAAFRRGNKATHHGWGLLYVDGRCIREIVKPADLCGNLREEAELLRLTICRIQLRLGQNITSYVKFAVAPNNPKVMRERRMAARINDSLRDMRTTSGVPCE